MTKVAITVTTEIDLDIETVAKWFVDLADDDMADFLIKIAEEGKKYPNIDNQWYYLGGHLRNCKCSTDEVREMIKQWAYWIEHSTHGKND